MAHIGVERLAAGDGQRDGPEHDEARRRCGDKDANCMRGVQCRKHPGASICSASLNAMTANHKIITGPKR